MDCVCVITHRGHSHGAFRVGRHGGEISREGISRNLLIVISIFLTKSFFEVNPEVSAVNHHTARRERTGRAAIDRTVVADTRGKHLLIGCRAEDLKFLRVYIVEIRSVDILIFAVSIDDRTGHPFSIGADVSLVGETGGCFSVGKDVVVGSALHIIYEERAAPAGKVMVDTDNHFLAVAGKLTERIIGGLAIQFAEHIVLDDAFVVEILVGGQSGHGLELAVDPEESCEFGHRSTLCSPSAHYSTVGARRVDETEVVTVHRRRTHREFMPGEVVGGEICRLRVNRADEDLTVVGDVGHNRV